MTNGASTKPATTRTATLNAAQVETLNLIDDGDFDSAKRGFLGSIEGARITNVAGEVVWDLAAYVFLETETAPDSVNPSLWRQARINQHHGLFRVTERIYQVRGFDIANMTLIEGESGLIIIDPLMFTETAQAALSLYREHRGERPVHTVIYSHSHPDHYGGVEGVLNPEDVRSGEVQVLAPAGFLEAAISETVLAGVPMRRRAMYQFGPTIKPGVCGHVDAGLGKRVGRGTTGLVAPTWLIEKELESHVIDGVEIVFQLTPETEAPAEMNFFFPSEAVLNLAENGCHTMHNLCPMRGAPTRDALAWSKYLDYALRTFIDRTDVVIAQHHWPTWGRDRARRFVTEQRDMYRYLHDQTLRLMGHGLTPNELAEEVALPLSLRSEWHTRPYYGALAHNVRAIYAHYMGPYDGNPATLNPLGPSEAGSEYVRYMGGADALLSRAQSDFDAGKYRWVVQVLNHLIFAEPHREDARALAADAMEQLGYQAEAATWRNAYLLGAKELREGPPSPPAGGIGAISPKVVAMMPMEMFFDFLAVRVVGPRADERELQFEWMLSDDALTYRLNLSHGALSHALGCVEDAGVSRVVTSRADLARIVNDSRSFSEIFEEGLINYTGDEEPLRFFFSCLDVFPPMFAVVEP